MLPSRDAQLRAQAGHSLHYIYGHMGGGWWVAIAGPMPCQPHDNQRPGLAARREGKRPRSTSIGRARALSQRPPRH